MSRPATSSSFQQRVYAALRRIPRGRVTTYQLLADSLHCRSAQAVGQALRRNPFAPQTPCHRVINSDLTIGGYSGKRGGPSIRRKLALLRKEGVNFRQGRLTDPSQLIKI